MNIGPPKRDNLINININMFEIDGTMERKC